VGKAKSSCGNAPSGSLTLATVAGGYLAQFGGLGAGSWVNGVPRFAGMGLQPTKPDRYGDLAGRRNIETKTSDGERSAFRQPHASVHFENGAE
jgi:hypothetical protein